MINVRSFEMDLKESRRRVDPDSTSQRKKKKRKRNSSKNSSSEGDYSPSRPKRVRDVDIQEPPSRSENDLKCAQKELKRKKKDKKLKHKKDKAKKKKKHKLRRDKHRDNREEIGEGSKRSKDFSIEPMLGAVEPPKVKRVMAPMTREEYEKKQSVMKHMLDPETGRYRLIKGDGEVMEEIVSHSRHREINKQSTRGDGATFQRMLGLG